MPLDYQEIAPPPALDQLITCIWFLTGRGELFSPQPVIPDGRLELLVHLGDPFSRIHADGSLERQDSLLVAGQLSGPIRLVAGRSIDVVGIRLTPAGAHAILDLPLFELSNQVLSLRDVRPQIVARLESAANRSGTPETRAQAIVTAFIQSLAADVDPAVSAACDALSAGYGGSLRDLAQRFGMSPRTLERRFRSGVGLAPKLFQRVVRFRRAFRMLGTAEPGSWAQVATRTGFYDQAHLIRDFTQFAGAPPTSFFRSDPVLAQAFSTANHGGREGHGDLPGA